MALAPITQRQQDRLQGLSLVAQAVLYMGRNDRKHGPNDQPIALQFPELLGQHPLGDAADSPLELVIALGAVQQMIECNALPFSADPLERGFDGAAARAVVTVESHKNLQQDTFCAYCTEMCVLANMLLHKYLDFMAATRS